LLTVKTSRYIGMSTEVTLKEKINKANGVCSHCLTIRQLHLNGGKVHRHGPRNKPCPGSNQSPLDGNSVRAGQNKINEAGISQLTGAESNPERPNGAEEELNPEIGFHPHLKGPIMKHVCKGARPACSRALTTILQKICDEPGKKEGWLTLLGFAPNILTQPPRAGRRRNISNIIRDRAEAWTLSQHENDNIDYRNVFSNPTARKTEALLTAVNAKLEEGNIRAAVRILCDQSQPAAPTEDNLRILQQKHPPDMHPENLAGLPSPTTTNALQVTEANVLEAIRTFPAGSAGGPDGFKPGHITDLLKHRESALALTKALTDFTNLLLRGGCPLELRPTLFGGNLIALNKNSGGLRPITIGYVWRRIVAKCANKFAISKLSTYFAPLQVGIGVPAGCEAAIHAVRRFINGMSEEQVVVKLDFENAFNSMRRDIMLEAVLDTVPEIYPFVHQAYRFPSVVKFGQYHLSSQTGPQQGDPLGPLLFCLPLQPILHALHSRLRIGFLDDVTLGGDLADVSEDIKQLALMETSMGLRLNHLKCEVFSKRDDEDWEYPMKGFAKVDREGISLLGAPLYTGKALDTALDQHCTTLRNAFQRLEKLPSQGALILLRCSFGASRLNHLLRCSPCFPHPTLEMLDEIMKTGLESIINVSLNDDQWLQATLPIRDGGLGLRRVVSLAPSAYMASAAMTLDLQRAILQDDVGEMDINCAELLEARKDLLPTIIDPWPTRQRAWDRPVVEQEKALLWQKATNAIDQARLIAVRSQHAGAWLSALPITSCGLSINNEAIRVAIGLRLGLDLCRPHTCNCGGLVGREGHHGLVCKKAYGRTLRHFTINDILWRALSRADVPSTKEPVGLFRTDGKRPDGATLIPWSGGRYLTWDATVVHTCASSYISHPNAQQEPAAIQAAQRKELKYSGLPLTHMFVPVALETLGPINPAGMDFIRELGKRMSVISGDHGETNYLFQRLSVCVQRFNAVAFRGTFPEASTSRTVVPDIDDN
jgi:Reverse transcriptase (RNA-dependent DNA polymerase)